MDITFGDYYFINGNINSVSVQTLTEDKVIISYSAGTYVSYRLYIGTISGTTITLGTAFNYDAVKLLTLSTDKVAAFYTDTNNILYVKVLTISDTDIIDGTSNAISDNGSSATYYQSSVSPVRLINNQILLVYGGTTSASIGYSIYLTIIGSVVKKDKEITLGSYAGFSLSAAALNRDKVFIAHSKDSSDYRYLYALISNVGVEKTTQSTDLLGVAKTKASDGDTVQVYLPDYN